MGDLALVEYLKAQKEKGFTATQLRSFLLEKGYPKEIVERSLIEVFKDPVKEAPKEKVEKKVEEKAMSPQAEKETAKIEKSVPLAVTTEEQLVASIPEEKNSHNVKHRSPAIVAVLSLITVSLYGIYWLVSTNNAMRQNSQVPLNSWILLTLLIPGVNVFILIFFYWRFAKAVHEYTGASAIPLMLLLLVFFPIGVAIGQHSLNKAH